MTIARSGGETEMAGLGYPSTMRAWLIQALTGRRAAEVLMMDFSPLLPFPGWTPPPFPRAG